MESIADSRLPVTEKYQVVFNPPTGSHHGRVWERCIRTTRKVIKAVTKEQSLEDEGINTLMCKVEAIVNGRPITNAFGRPAGYGTTDPQPPVVAESWTNTPTCNPY